MNKWLIIPIILLACDSDRQVKATQNQYPHTMISINAYVDVLHDQQNHTTCWIYSSNGYNGSISCLPDKSFASFAP